MTEDGSAAARRNRPHPDAAGKATSLAQITPRSWRYVASRTLREFFRDECPDLAAALTYYGVLAVLPGLIALVSVLGVVGQGQRSVETVLDVARQVVPRSGMEILRAALEGLSQSSAATLGLVLGIVGALWFVSRYLGAFGRAMNRIYAIPEGRPLWKLEPQMLVVTLLFGALCGCAIIALVVSGPVAEAIGNVLGIGSTVVTLWNIAKWPLLAAIVVVVIALLYYITPNVRQPRFRWLSPGALLAIVAWVIGSVLFGLYVSNFSQYDATYGSLAGLIVFLIWLWVTNSALLLGAELDAEIERVRELQAGIVAERGVQLPPRDIRATIKAEAGHAADVRRGRRIRHSHAETSSPHDDRAD